MKLYEINLEIENLINEDGEILELEKFAQLQIARDEKIESMVLWVKNLEAEVTAVKAEKDNLAKREKACKKNADTLKAYLSELLLHKTFKTPKCSCTFRKSTRTEVDAEFTQWAKVNADEYLKYEEPKVDTLAIKEAIKAGSKFKYARIVEIQNLQIK